MFGLLRFFLGSIVRSTRSRSSLLLEILALRQQLAVLKERKPQPRLTTMDKLFWVILHQLWPGWKRALVIVQPETVIRWHRAGFKLYWKWLSRHRPSAGRKCVNKDLRDLIFKMVAENQTWGAPRIHGELKMLGFNISERTVLRWMRKAPRNPEPAERWKTFLQNHREAIAAMDFFGSNVDLWSAVRLLCDFARPQTHLTLWRNEASDQRLGNPAITRCISLWLGTRVLDL
jgi:putative transposase